MTTHYLVFEPELDKSRAIIHLLSLATQDPIILIHQLDKKLIDSYVTNHTVFIPTGLISTQFVLTNYALTRYGKRVSHNAIEIGNKPYLLKLAQHLGVPVPITWQQPDEIEYFPIFYKERQEAGGGIRGIAYNLQDIPTAKQNQLIFQPLIESQGTYGLAFWAENGHIITCTAHHEVYSLPASGGSGVYLRHYPTQPLLAHTQSLVQVLNYTGWGLAEFKYCPKQQQFLLMEINTKLWASIEFSLRNDPTLAYYVLGTTLSLPPINELVFMDNFFKSDITFILKQSSLLLKPRVSYQFPQQSLL